MISKAVNRLTWRFGAKKSFVANAEDIASLNELISFVNAAREEKLQQNVGFAKMYIWAYSELMRRYDTDVFDDKPQVELHKLLNMPLEYFVKKFTDYLNSREQELFFEELKIPIKNFRDVTKEGGNKLTGEETERIMTALEQGEGQRLRFEGKVYDEETVLDNLEPLIADALIKFKL